jgi:hypothetical protein
VGQDCVDLSSSHAGKIGPVHIAFVNNDVVLFGVQRQYAELAWLYLRGAISPHREFSGKMKRYQRDLVD